MWQQKQEVGVCKEEVMSQGMQVASGGQKRQRNWFSSRASRRNKPSWYLDVEPVKLISDFLSPELEEKKCVSF